MKFRSMPVVAAAVLVASAGWCADLNGAGATFPNPLYQKWASEYNKGAGVQINYQSVGSGAGIKQLKEKTVDFGGSDAPLSDEEAKGMPGTVLHVPTVAGAVSVIYNLPGVEKGLKLSPRVLQGIYLGFITNWNDPRIKEESGVALPARKITVVHRSDGSGTSYIFTDYLCSISPDWKQKVGKGKSVNWPVGVGGKGNEGVSQTVKQTEGSIGYCELQYCIANKLKSASLKNKSGAWVTPTLASTTAAVAAGTSTLKSNIRASLVNQSGAKVYPIVGVTYLMVYQNQADHAKGGKLVAFLKWANSKGQSFAEGLNYAKLPEALVSYNTATIGKIKVP